MKGPSDFESGGRMSTYMLNETKGREREMLPEGRQRIPFNEDCLRWRPPRRRDGKPL